MKSTSIILAVLLAATSCFGGEQETAFEESFRTAISTSDEATLKLVAFSRSTPVLFRDMIVQSLKEDRTKKVKTITFLDPAKEAAFEFEYEGVTYTTTLPVLKEMKITYDMTNDTSSVDGTTYRLGLDGDHYKIVAPTPK